MLAGTGRAATGKPGGGVKLIRACPASRPPRPAGGPSRARKLAGSLTEREVEVLAGLGEGLSNAQIAARLHLSEATVKGYVSRMLDKLGLDNRTQAGLLAHDAASPAGSTAVLAAHAGDRD